MVDSTSPDTRRVGLAAGRLLVAAGLVVAGLFVGAGVSAADLAPGADAAAAVSGVSGGSPADVPATDDPNGSRIG